MTSEFAREVLCNNPQLLDLPDQALPVLSHDRSDHNTKQWSTGAYQQQRDQVTTVWRYHFAGKVLKRAMALRSLAQVLVTQD